MLSWIKLVLVEIISFDYFRTVDAKVKRRLLEYICNFHQAIIIIIIIIILYFHREIQSAINEAAIKRGPV